MLGNEESHFVVELYAFRLGLLFQDGDTHFQFGRLDLHGQTQSKRVTRRSSRPLMSFG